MATLTVPGNSSGSGGIPTLLDNNLNISPYFDDFDATKQYYKVLFKPGVAVQVRELNQLQTILQNQIASFGQNIFKEGSVIKGCSFTFDNNYSYVKLNDTYANSTALTVSDLQDLVVTNSRGLKGVIVNTLPGLVSTTPDLNTIYIKYNNSATYANGATQSQFDPGETLSFTTSAGTSQGSVAVALSSDAIGTGYAFTTTEGIIFKKGYFIYVAPQTAIISKYSNIPDNISVGFEATETLINSNSDQSLFDNAAGAPNYTAPGSDRLKLEPNLVTKTTDVASTTTFFSLVDFKQGQPITIHNDTQFNSIAVEEAKRTYETNGDFVVDQFDVSSQTIANTSDSQYSTHYNAIVSKGLGYVEGYRVQFLNNNTVRARRGTDKSSVSAQKVSLSMGNYIFVNQVYGNYFNSSSVVRVELHSVAKQAITNLSVSRDPSTVIGYAYVRGFNFFSGIQGSYNSQYKLYLFNITMINAGKNFADVKSIIYWDGSSIKAVSDVVLTNGIAVPSSVAYKTMLFPFGQKAITPDGFGSINFNYRSLFTPTFNSPTNAFSSTTVQITNVGTPTYNDTFNYSSTNTNDLIVIPQTTATTLNKSGNVAIYDAIAVALNPNTAGVNSAANTIKISVGLASSRFQINDPIYYAVSTGNTAIGGLTGNTLYYVSFANTTDIALSSGPGGSNLYVYETRTSATAETGHTFTANVGYVYKQAGTTTSFFTDYSVGDFITINSAVTKQIVNIPSNDLMVVSGAYNGSDLTNVTHKKSFPAGVAIPFDRNSRSITIDGTGKTLTLNIGEYISSSFQVNVDASINRAAAKSIIKQINKGYYVKIDCSSHAATNKGPWSLGLPDVLSIDNIYVDQSGTGYSESGTNYVDSFVLDNGQRDSHYDLSSIKLKTGPFGLSSTAKILVKLSVFTQTSGEGVGFFTCNSYPINDSSYSATNSITTIQIPQYTSSDNILYDLRDVVDFRPYADTTGIVAASISSACTNPSSTLTFSSTPYFPAPDSSFTSNISYYLSRSDRIALDTNGNIVIKEGAPGVSNPPPPQEQAKTMTLAVLKIPPYPSLTMNEARAKNRYDNAIQSKAVQQRRYSMSDIGKIDHRITNLEYYTSLSVLEQSAATLQVRSTQTGQTRFQNGIFVDGFNGFDLSNTKHPNFFISIDGARTELRPAHFQMRSEFSVDIDASTNVVQAGDLVMLKHTSDNVYIKQNYASKYRNCIEGNIFHYNGTITLTPPGSTAPDIGKPVEVTADVDNYSNWVNIAKAWGTQWNNWETVSSKRQDTLISAAATDPTNVAAYQTVDGYNGGAYGGTINTTTTQTLQTTQQVFKLLGTTLSTSPEKTTNQDLGTYLTSAQITPYIPAATIYFEASGMKPNTRVYAYFNNTPVSAWCAPNKFYPYGTRLDTNASGNASGYFRIPEGTFKAGELTFKLLDIDDLSKGQSAISTEADGIFYGRTLSLSQGHSILSTRSTVVSSAEVKSNDITINGTGVSTDITQQFIANPAPYSGGGDSCGCGWCFITTAAVDVIGEDDDGPTLTTLRWFRDNIMLTRDDWRADAEEYYRIAPSIVEALNELPNSKEIYTSIYHDCLLNAVKFIKNEQYEEAYITYRDMVNKYKEYVEV